MLDRATLRVELIQMESGPGLEVDLESLGTQRIKLYILLQRLDLAVLFQTIS